MSNPHGKKIHTYGVDLSDRAKVVGVVKDVMHDHGRVDILINNAGYTAPAAIHQINFADFERRSPSTSTRRSRSCRSCCTPGTRSS